MNLHDLQEITDQRDAIDRQWRTAIKALAPQHSTRTIARAAGVSHVTVFHMTKGVTR